MGSSPSSFFLGKVTALGVLCCFALFVCLTLLASFFLPSHLSFKNMYYSDFDTEINYYMNMNEKARKMHTPKAASDFQKQATSGGIRTHDLPLYID